MGKKRKNFQENAQFFCAILSKMLILFIFSIDKQAFWCLNIPI
jgi:hypothetical protein